MKFERKRDPRDRELQRHSQMFQVFTGWIRIFCDERKADRFRRVGLGSIRIDRDRLASASVPGLMASTTNSIAIANDSPFCEARHKVKKIEDDLSSAVASCCGR